MVSYEPRTVSVRSSKIDKLIKGGISNEYKRGLVGTLSFNGRTYSLPDAIPLDEIIANQRTWIILKGWRILTEVL